MSAASLFSSCSRYSSDLVVGILMRGLFSFQGNVQYHCTKGATFTQEEKFCAFDWVE